MFHSDLSLYTNKKFRSFNFINLIWEHVESKILFHLGIFETSIISIVYESQYIFVTITSDYVNYCNEKIKIDSNNILTYSENFNIDVNITLKNTKTSYVCVENCRYYYSDKEDDGFIEFIINSAINYNSLYDLKKNFITLLSLEAQYAINKIFIDSKLDTFKTEIDCYYEYVYSHSVLNKTDFKDELKILTASNNVDKNVSRLLSRLIKKIEGKK